MVKDYMEEEEFDFVNTDGIKNETMYELENE
jgi:hypothetical protein